MRPRAIVAGVLIFVLGVLLGVLATRHWFSDELLTAEERLAKQRKSEPENWPPREFNSSAGWTFLKVDESGWSTGPVGSFQNLDERLARPVSSGQEIVVPIFPTVYTPLMADKPYYDAILENDIKPGNKVLVIGTGSGADAWVASLKSKSPVYVVEINPMAIANARATARLGNFQIKAVTGDITNVKLPEDFHDFDFVLWNMPFVWKKGRMEATKGRIENNNFYDGDDGTILKKFLTLLPSLLKKGGKAIILNGPPATEMLATHGTMTKSNQNCVLFVIPN